MQKTQKKKTKPIKGNGRLMKVRLKYHDFYEYVSHTYAKFELFTEWRNI